MTFPNFFPHNLRKIAAVALLCLFGAVATKAQQEDPVEVVDTNLVVLNVGVADRKGEAMTDLSRSDFVVYEDGVKQSIVNFEPVSAPFSLVLLLDMSGSTLNFRQTLNAERGALR